MESHVGEEVEEKQKKNRKSKKSSLSEDQKNIVLKYERKEERLFDCLQCRLEDWAYQGKWLDAKQIRPLRGRVRNFVRAYGKNRPYKELAGWDCALGQLFDLTQKEVYNAIPYLLTAYMYNYFCANLMDPEKNMKGLSQVSFASCIKSYTAKIPDGYDFKDEVYFGMKPGKISLPDDPIGALLNGRECDSLQFEGDYILPKMSMRQNSFFFDTIMPLKCVSKFDEHLDFLESQNCVESPIVWEKQKEAKLYISKWEYFPLEFFRVFAVWFRLWTEIKSPNSEYWIDPVECVILMYKNFFGLSQFNWETQNEWEKLFYMALEAEDSRCRNSRNKSLEEIICKKIWTFAADLFRIR